MINRPGPDEDAKCCQDSYDEFHHEPTVVSLRNNSAKTFQEVIRKLEAALSHKGLERERINRGFFKGLITEKDQDKYLREMGQDASLIEQELSKLRKAAADRESNRRALDGAGSLLEKLRSKLDQPLPFAERRRIVEALVAGITVSKSKAGQPQVQIAYNFEPHAERFMRSWDDSSGLALANTGPRADNNCAEYELCGVSR